MNALATLKNFWLAVALLLLALPCRGNEMEDVEGPNVRFMRHEDGSKSVFIRSPDNKTLTKKTFSPNGVLTMLTTYKMDANGNPLGCKIRDGLNQEQPAA